MIQTTETYELFSRWPAVPLLHLYAAQAELLPYLGESVQKSQTNSDHAERIDGHILDAERYLISWLARMEISRKFLLDSTLMPDYIHQYFVEQCPNGQVLKAMTEIRRIAESLGVAPDTFSEEMFSWSLVLEIRNMGAYYTRQETLPILGPSHKWQHGEWLRYFSLFPTDEFRFPAMKAISHLRSLGGKQWTAEIARVFGKPRNASLYPIDYNATNWSDHSSWDEKNDEPHEPWQS